MADDKDGMTGRDLKESQSGGESGRFGRNVHEKQGAGQTGAAAPHRAPAPAEGRSRGELEDERANGGRGPESVSPSDDEIARDERAHQDRGQSDVEFEREQN